MIGFLEYLYDDEIPPRGGLFRGKWVVGLTSIETATVVVGGWLDEGSMRTPGRPITLVVLLLLNTVDDGLLGYPPFVVVITVVVVDLIGTGACGRGGLTGLTDRIESIWVGVK